MLQVTISAKVLMRWHRYNSLLITLIVHSLQLCAKKDMIQKSFLFVGTLFL